MLVYQRVLVHGLPKVHQNTPWDWWCRRQYADLKFAGRDESRPRWPSQKILSYIVVVVQSPGGKYHSLAGWILLNTHHSWSTHHLCLVGGFNPSGKKKQSIGIIIPTIYIYIYIIWKSRKCSKPPTSCWLFLHSLLVSLHRAPAPSIPAAVELRLASASPPTALAILHPSRFCFRNEIH